MKWITAIFIFFASMSVTALIAGQMQRAGIDEVYQLGVGIGIPVFLSISTFILAHREESR